MKLVNNLINAANMATASRPWCWARKADWTRT